MSRHFGVQTSTARKNHRSGHTEGRLTTTPSGRYVRKGTPCGHSACIREPFPVEAAPRVPQHPPDECPMRGRPPGQHTTPAFTRASAPAANSCARALGRRPALSRAGSRFPLAHDDSEVHPDGPRRPGEHCRIHRRTRRSGDVRRERLSSSNATTRRPADCALAIPGKAAASARHRPAAASGRKHQRS